MIIIPDNSQAGFYAQKVIHNSMQVMGGIGYTNVFPVERIYRDVRLASIGGGYQRSDVHDYRASIGYTIVLLTRIRHKYVSLKNNSLPLDKNNLHNSSGDLHKISST
jgi:hypothetical protein